MSNGGSLGKGMYSLNACEHSLLVYLCHRITTISHTLDDLVHARYPPLHMQGRLSLEERYEMALSA